MQSIYSNELSQFNIIPEDIDAFLPSFWPELKNCFVSEIGLLHFPAIHEHLNSTPSLLSIRRPSKCFFQLLKWIHLARWRDSSVGIATRYGLDGQGIESRWEARFPAPVQTGPGAHPASYTTGTGSFPGVKRPGRGVDHPPLSSGEVEGRVELYICSPSGSSWPVLGWNLPLLLSPNE